MCETLTAGPAELGPGLNSAPEGAVAATGTRQLPSHCIRRIFSSENIGWHHQCCIETLNVAHLSLQPIDTMFSSNIVQGSKLYCTHAPRSVRPRLAVNICAAITVDKTDMKQMRKPRQENVGTDFFVDHTCIDWFVPGCQQFHVPV